MRPARAPGRAGGSSGAAAGQGALCASADRGWPPAARRRRGSAIWRPPRTHPPGTGPPGVVT
eukprot:2900551-Prymnesium_polylepis.1